MYTRCGHRDAGNGNAPNILLSIHDVMPETMAETGQILDLLRELEQMSCVLLVVPGRKWESKQIETLAQWQEKGLTLAGHGWIHSCTAPRGFYHRLHSAMISRRVAEHLPLNESEILQLLHNCHGWFADKGLKSPDFYVPPAWAMGAVRMERLSESPFRYFEYFSGVYDAIEKSFTYYPLSGYEADTVLRAAALRMFNAGNKVAGNCLNRPMRIAIHPYDFNYKMSNNLLADLKYNREKTVRYGSCKLESHSQTPQLPTLNPSNTNTKKAHYEN